MVLGVDTASDRWHAILRNPNGFVGAYQEKRRSKGTKTNPAEPPDVRRMHLHNSFKYNLAVEWPTTATFHIFCEEPIALKNGKTTRLLGLAAGAIWAAHLDFDVFWHWVDIASWKKEICGNGGISPAGYVAWSLEHGGGQEDWDEDHHAANCLSLYGIEWLAKLT